jgi:hypothetical protein
MEIAAAPWHPDKAHRHPRTRSKTLVPTNLCRGSDREAAATFTWQLIPGLIARWPSS